LTLETLNALLGATLSLLLSFTTIRTWFENLSADLKRVLIIALLALISLSTYLLACSPLALQLDLSIQCDQHGLVELVSAFLAALISNQATYSLSPKRPLPQP
jgi:hypothetical protein